MSYSNGKLPEDTFSHEKIIEIVKGLPGVGFKLTDAGDYDIQNKKLRNVAPPETNNDVTTKSYVDNKALLVDGSNKMLGALNMDNRRIENVAPARHGFSDAVSSLHLTTFFFDLNTNDGKIEAQNPIDMKNEKISNLAEGTDNSDAITKHQLETGLAPKADKTELASYLKRDGTVSVTGDFDFGDNKITKVGNGSNSTDVVNKGYIDTALAAKPNANQVVLRDGTQEMTGDLDMSNKKIKNLADPTGVNDAAGKGYVDRLFLDALRLDGSAKMTGNLDMNNKRIINVANPISETDVVNKRYFETHVENIDLSDYLKRDGTVSVTGDFDFGDNKITKVGNGTQSTDLVNKGYIDTALATKPNVNQVVLRDGSNTMTSVLDMNNQRIINLRNATHNQDAITLKQVNDGIATVSTENNRYTDEQIEKNKKYVDDEIAKSHITTHTNRKNVLKYAMDDGEFTEDYGIQDANLIDYNDSPHKNNKKAFSLKAQKAKDGSSLFKGRFDFNLFKLIRDNYSDKYTVCLEIYFQKTGFDAEFNSLQVTFEKINMNTDRTTTVKTNPDYKYYRFIMNLSPDGSSPDIERRLYVTVQSTYDNRSPTLLPLYVLIYGIKGEAKNNLDFTIYDYEKAYEVVNDQFQMHVPIDMNNNKITNLKPPVTPADAVNKRYLFLANSGHFYWGKTVRTPGQSKYYFYLTSGFILNTPKMYVVNILLHAEKTYPSSTNHKLNIVNNHGTTLHYNINLSARRTIDIGVHRYEDHQNYYVTHDGAGDNRVYQFVIYYKPYEY